MHCKGLCYWKKCTVRVCFFIKFYCTVRVVLKMPIFSPHIPSVYKPTAPPGLINKMLIILHLLLKKETLKVRSAVKLTGFVSFVRKVWEFCNDFILFCKINLGFQPWFSIFIVTIWRIFFLKVEFQIKLVCTMLFKRCVWCLTLTSPNFMQWPIYQI